jgi:hypothetical protein
LGQTIRDSKESGLEPLGEEAMIECHHGVPLDTDCPKCQALGGDENLDVGFGPGIPYEGAPRYVAPSIEPTVEGRKCEPSGTCLDNGLQPLVERLLDHGAEPSYRVWERALFIEAADALERMGKEIEAVSAARVVCEEYFLDEQEKAQARIAELEEEVDAAETYSKALSPRIAELEGMLADCEEGLFKHHLDKRDARIAELEGALREIADLPWRVDTHPNVPAIARAVLKETP